MGVRFPQWSCGAVTNPTMSDQEYANLRIPRETYEKAKAAKEEYGETWEEFIERALESPSTKGLNEEDVREIVREMVVGGALRD